MTHSDDLNAKVLDLKSTIKFQMKKVSVLFCMIFNETMMLNYYTQLSESYVELFDLNTQFSPTCILHSKARSLFNYIDLYRCSACPSPSATSAWLKTTSSRTFILPWTSSSRCWRSTGRTSGRCTSSPPWDQCRGSTKQCLGRIYMHSHLLCIPVPHAFMVLKTDLIAWICFRNKFLWDTWAWYSSVFASF